MTIKCANSFLVAHKSKTIQTDAEYFDFSVGPESHMQFILECCPHTSTLPRPQRIFSFMILESWQTASNTQQKITYKTGLAKIKEHYLLEFFRIQMHHPTSIPFLRKSCFIRKKTQHHLDHIHTGNMPEVLSF